MKIDKFSNRIAFEIGKKVIELALSRDQKIGLLIERLNHPVMFYMMDGLSKDKVNWLYRKSNAVKHFEMSTKDLQEKIKEDMVLSSKYGLDLSDYTCVPGGLPLFLDDNLIGVISVTGLSPDEDHALAVEAFNAYKKEAENDL
ncbi:heme-binding protein [Acidaminobacter sp. JC074]|uniref:heme-binding protein n=1 Tax=Acidaminobacter sp. JC074 TaxID=2530199 RepID=UPI001F0D0856|nr:heme-binding protein [Acidaminobacter sp. JC074]MCH4886445.1 heme-binding protein [Acidaminobacter sp. JC074]